MTFQFVHRPKPWFVMLETFLWLAATAGLIYVVPLSVVSVAAQVVLTLAVQATVHRYRAQTKFYMRELSRAVDGEMAKALDRHFGDQR